MTFILPTHCYACGVLLMGGATKHLAHCEIRRLIEQTMAGADECVCRTASCGHRASSHIGGHCFECGQYRCWR